jgi:hypothetical protein
MSILKNQILSIRSIFILLVVLTVLVAVVMFTPDWGIIRGPNMLILWALHMLTGLGLVVMVYKQKVTGKTKLFLLIAGFAGISFLVGVVLHNLFYALGMLAGDLPVLPAILSFLDGSFFLIAVVLCPLGLLVGIVGAFFHWKEIPTGK